MDTDLWIQNRLVSRRVQRTPLTPKNTTDTCLFVNTFKCIRYEIINRLYVFHHGYIWSAAILWTDCSLLDLVWNAPQDTNTEQYE